MQDLRYFGAILALSFFCNGAALAQSDLEKLIEQTGIEAGDIAAPGIQFIKATSEADAILNVVDPELGY
jgi:hypothetical protein